jgi:hypothetical protein
MKKYIFAACLLVFAFALTGCGKQVMMDQLNSKGVYPYSNDMLGFNLSLPKEFQYYQTQRTNFTNYTDLDIFVPTADTNYAEQLPGYAEPVIVRVYDKSTYDGLAADIKAQSAKVAEKGGKVYTMIFWANIPSDFKDKWSDAMKQQLIKDFKLK